LNIAYSKQVKVLLLRLTFGTVCL